jgi:hypothetical protein
LLLNGNLQTEQNKDFILRIKTEGKVVPENAMIFIDGESYFMENSKAGEFQFKIAKRISDVVFHVEGNAVSSEVSVESRCSTNDSQFRDAVKLPVVLE